MQIQQLKQLVPPPSNPFRSIEPRQWKDIETQLGFSFPEDYKEFCQIYGCGVLAGFYNLFCPQVRNRHINLIQAATEKLDAYKQIEKAEGLPFPLYSHGSGLYPFGVTDNGDVLFWQVQDRHVLSTTIVNESRGPIWEKYDIGFAGFLLKALRNELVSAILPNDFQENELTFEPLISR